jgi:hypothetical protein
MHSEGMRLADLGPTPTGKTLVESKQRQEAATRADRRQTAENELDDAVRALRED